MHWSYVFLILTQRFIPSNIQIGDDIYDIHDVLHDNVHWLYAKLILCVQISDMGLQTESMRWRLNLSYLYKLYIYDICFIKNCYDGILFVSLVSWKWKFIQSCF